MPFLIRRFGLTDYGVYLLAGSLTVYLGLFDFGVGTTVMKYIAEFRAKGDEESLGRLVSNVVFYYSAVGVIAATALYLFSQYGIGIFKLPPESVPLARHLFELSAIVALFTWPLMVGGVVLNGLQRYDLSARVGSAVVLGNVAATALVLIVGQGPLMLLGATAVVSISGGVAYSVMARRLISDAPLSFRLVQRSTLRMIFSFSWVVFVMQLASVIIYQQTDRMVLGIFVGAAAVGLYEAASKINGLVTQLASMPIAALMPAASQFEAEERSEMLHELLVRGSKYTNAFVLPIATSLIVLAAPLITAWLGPLLATQAHNAQLFVSYWLVWVNLMVAFNIFVGTGRLRFLLWFAIAQAALNLALSLILVQHFQVRGVILGTWIANMVLFPIGLTYALRTLKLSVREWLRRVVAPTYPLLLVPAGIGLLAMRVGLTTSLAGVAVAGILCVGTYWLAVFAVALSSAERGDLLGMLVSIRRRLGLGGEA